MISFRLTPVTAMRVIRKTVFILGIIISGEKSPAQDPRVNSILWLTGVLNSGVMLVTQIGSMIVRRNDIITLLQLIPEFMVLSAIVTRLFIWKRHWRILQKLVEEWDNFIANATEEEEAILQKYCDKVGPFHLLIFVLTPSAVLMYLAMPAITSKRLPLDMEFLFATPTGSPIWFTLYLVEIHATWVTGAAAIMDLMLLVLLWSTSARFEMLHDDFRAVKCIDDVRRCLRQQIYLKELLTELKRIVNWMGFTITVVVLIGVSTGGFLVITETSLGGFVFFALVMTINTMQLFMYCWAGDSLIDTSQGLVNACFEADCVDASREVKQCLRIIMEGSRRPMVISVNGLLPIMSLEYFSSSMSAVISYIAMLRATTR